MNIRQLFLQHIAQTSEAPLAVEISRAEGCYLYDAAGNPLLDLIAGISVCNIGHSNPSVIKAITEQAQRYMHIMVYGELVQQPQVAYAQLLTQHLPAHLNSVYFTNSGAEAVEGAMKLAKRVTNRRKIFAFHNSYHGSTQGALSLLGNEYFRNAFRPLLPEVYHFEYGSEAIFSEMDESVAAVVAEAIQAEGGVAPPPVGWLKRLEEVCKEKGALLVIDEIQSGFGRSGSLWAFEREGIRPDILLLGKALGGGMPLGAFIADVGMMNQLSFNPVLGHITTFGGHPVSCAAGKAAFSWLLQHSHIITEAANNVQLLVDSIVHSRVKKKSRVGAWAAITFENYELNKRIIDICLTQGLFTDWFLFAANSLRIAPPLIITKQQAINAAEIMNKAIEVADSEQRK